MTGPYDDDDASVIFDHLDDPTASAPSSDVLSSVVHRGRRIRARRQGVFALSGAAAVAVAVIGGLGLSHTVDAQRGHDTVVPAHPPTASASASTSTSANDHQPPGDAVVVPREAVPPAVVVKPSPPAPAPSAEPCGEPVPPDSASPEPDPSSVPAPLVPTASPQPLCGSPSPSPSSSTSPSETPSPSESPTPTETPAAP